MGVPPAIDTFVLLLVLGLGVDALEPGFDWALLALEWEDGRSDIKKPADDACCFGWVCGTVGVAALDT